MDDVFKLMARTWWVLLIRGIAAIAFGLAAFAWPGLTLAVLVIMFGAYILIDGVMSVIDAIQNKERMTNWKYGLFEGLLGVAVGLLMLFMPGVTALVLLSFVAVWSIIGGVLRVVAAIRMRHEIEGEGIMILSGVLSALFGIAILVLPHAGLVSIAWMIGFWASTFGVVFILLSLKLRKMAD